MPLGVFLEDIGRASAWNVRVGAASRSAFLASMGLLPVRDLRGHFLGAPARGFKRRSRIGADSGAQRLAGVGMAEAVSERASAIGGDAQNKSGLPQVCNLEPAACAAASSCKGVRQNLAHTVFLSEKKSGGLGVKSGDTRGTQNR